MKDKSISLMNIKRIHSILNSYSILSSIFAFIPLLLLLSLSLVIFFKILWIFLLIIFLLITFFLPLLNDNFRNTLKNSFNGGESMNAVMNFLISTYYLPLILTCISATFLIISIILSICNRKYTNAKNGLIGAIVMFIVALISCLIYYLCFDMFIGGQ